VRPFRRVADQVHTAHAVNRVGVPMHRLVTTVRYGGIL